MAFSDTLDSVKKWCLGIRSRDEAEEGIRRDTKLQESLKTWSKRTGKVAIGMFIGTVIIRAGFFLAPTAICIGVYGLVKLASYLVDRDIRQKREAEAAMAAAEPAPQPAAKPTRQMAPKLSAKATGAFNADAAKPQAPANDEVPAITVAGKARNLLKKVGL